MTFNSSDVIEGLISSLPAALGELTADVVIVDNGSTDDTVERAERLPGCRVVRAENRGYSAGINRGIREAEPAGAVLILNPDVRLAAGSVIEMMKALQTPGTGIVAPQVRTEDGELFLSLRREPTILRGIGLNRTGIPIFSEYVSERESYQRAVTVDWALGAVLLISAACQAAVGEWDESYFLYSEETQFCLQAKDLGFATRYEPSAVAVHIGGSSGRNEITHAMQVVNRIRLYARRHGAVSSYAYLGANLLSEFSWVLRGRSESWFAMKALIRPRLRPAQLGCSDRLLPT